MKRLIFTVFLFCSALTINALAYQLPVNALSYGLTTPQHSVEDPTYGGGAASAGFITCMKEAMTGGQANACYSDEIDRINHDIDSLMNAVFDSKTVPNDAKIRYIKGVKTDLNRINYLCDIFKIDAEGNKIDDSDSADVGAIYSCRINRLSSLKSSITRTVNEI
ncbi:hypothetical protein ACN0IV_12680 [Trabulsiella odontotermitis]|uniref:hypothetical protein n=1 Tax=Trabulsiella odontotermitis TaxID=379893 RepID=UPI003AD32598